MWAYVLIYLILTSDACVQFPIPTQHEEARQSVLHIEDTGSASDEGDGPTPLRPRRRPDDDAPDRRGDHGHPGPDGYEPLDEKLRFDGIDLADQGRSRPSSPEGYPWPLSLAAETADPATLISILKKSHR